MDFYNTIDSEGQELDKNEKDAKSQTKTVYDFFKEHPFGLFTAPEVQTETGIKCQGSVKRAVSTLKGYQMLIKTDQYIIGEWGKPNYKYRLNVDRI